MLKLFGLMVSNVAVPPRDDAQGNGGFQAAGQPQKVEDDLPF